MKWISEFIIRITEILLDMPCSSMNKKGKITAKKQQIIKQSNKINQKQTKNNKKWTGSSIWMLVNSTMYIYTIFIEIIKKI